MEVQEIKFNGLDFILTSPDKSHSPIATKKAFQKGEVSYAQLYKATGKIMQLGHQIGTVDDITFGDIVDIDFNPIEFMSGMLGNTWPF